MQEFRKFIKPYLTSHRKTSAKRMLFNAQIRIAKAIKKNPGIMKSIKLSRLLDSERVSSASYNKGQQTGNETGS